jgi:hypothetical protein
LEPLQVDTATQAQDDDDANQTMTKESRPDEDINEEIVHDPNVLAEVLLPSRICQLQLIMYHDLPQAKWFIQINDGPSTKLHSSFSNPISQR